MCGERPSAVVYRGTGRLGASAASSARLPGHRRSRCPGDARVPCLLVQAWQGRVPVVLLSSHLWAIASRRCPPPTNRAQAEGCCSVGVAAGWAERARVGRSAGASAGAGFSRRAALGYLFGAMAGAFAACGLAASGYRRGSARAGWKRSTREPRLASGWWHGATDLRVVGVVDPWRMQLSENAKMQRPLSSCFPPSSTTMRSWPREGGGHLRLAAPPWRVAPAARAHDRRRLRAIAPTVVLIEHVPGRGDTAAARAFSMVAHWRLGELPRGHGPRCRPSPGVDGSARSKQRQGEY